MFKKLEETPIFLPLVFSINATDASGGDNSALSNRDDRFCRFGLNHNTLGVGDHTKLGSYDIASLGVGWYINYGAGPSANVPAEIEHASMIRVSATSSTTYSHSPHKAAISSIAMNSPGRIWFIGNEPDRIKFQDGIVPHLYADVYHELYTFIKSVDPTAQIYAGSIVQPTEVRLEYLDKVIESYENKYGTIMPVDGWSIHNFILNEASCDHYDDLNICWGADIPPGIDATDGLRIGINKHHDIELFKTQIVNFRQWMNENGYQGKPVYLSEYGVLLPDWYRPTVDFSPSRINEFMSASFDYVLNEKDETLGDPADEYRLVQRLSWYSVNDSYSARSSGEITYPYSYNGNLFDPLTLERSAMGNNYAHYTLGLDKETDYYPYSLDIQSVPITPASAQFTVTLNAMIANSGNQNDAFPTTVSIFEGDPDGGGTQIGETQPVALSGCGSRAAVELTWGDVPTGTYDIFVRVDSSDLFTETSMVNNIYSRTITVTKATR